MYGRIEDWFVSAYDLDPGITGTWCCWDWKNKILLAPLDNHILTALDIEPSLILPNPECGVDGGIVTYFRGFFSPNTIASIFAGDENKGPYDPIAGEHTPFWITNSVDRITLKCRIGLFEIDEKTLMKADEMLKRYTVVTMGKTTFAHPYIMLVEVKPRLGVIKEFSFGEVEIPLFESEEDFEKYMQGFKTIDGGYLVNYSNQLCFGFNELGIGFFEYMMNPAIVEDLRIVDPLNVEDVSELVFVGRDSVERVQKLVEGLESLHDVVEILEKEGFRAYLVEDMYKTNFAMRVSSKGGATRIGWITPLFGKTEEEIVEKLEDWKIEVLEDSLSEQSKQSEQDIEKETLDEMVEEEEDVLAWKSSKVLK